MALTKLTTNLISGDIVTSVNGSSGAVTLETGTDWQTAIQTSNFTAVASKGYFVNTTSAEVTITLPVGAVGDEIVIQDYAGTFATNKIILAANGSEKIQGAANDFKCVINNSTVTLIYQDATKGWTADNIEENLPPLTVNYLVIAGGGGGAGTYHGGGGGAGGLRTSYGSITGGGGSAETSLSLIASTNYTITVGGGGAGGVGSTNNPGFSPSNGVNSKFGVVGSEIESTGGGYGGYYQRSGGDGGSGGGANGATGTSTTPGSAVTSPVTQGFIGGITSSGSNDAGGGGGASEAGKPGGTAAGQLGAGGSGLAVNILNATNAATASVGEVSGSDIYYAGGGGGAPYPNDYTAQGGLGGGGNGSYSAGGSGIDNTGGGGGGSERGSGTSNGGNGGSGVVIIQYPSAYTVSGLAQATGSPFTEGTYKVSVFTTGTGTITFT